jgi:hypothetical protein
LIGLVVVRGRSRWQLLGSPLRTRSEVVAGMQKHLANALGMLRTGIEEITGTVEGIERAAEKLEEVLSRFARVGVR